MTDLHKRGAQLDVYATYCCTRIANWFYSVTHSDSVSFLFRFSESWHWFLYLLWKVPTTTKTLLTFTLKFHWLTMIVSVRSWIRLRVLFFSVSVTHLGGVWNSSPLRIFPVPIFYGQPSQNLIPATDWAS